MIEYNVARPTEPRHVQTRPMDHGSTDDVRSISPLDLQSAQSAPAVLDRRGIAWIAAIQGSAGNQAAAHLITRSGARQQPMRSTASVGVGVAPIAVQRGGPGLITKADQQIDFDLHPDPKAPGQPKTPGWRAMSLKGGTQIVYILSDSRTGEVLKVGKSTRRSFKARFGEYVSAGNKWGRKLKVTMFTLRQRSGKTVGQFEAEIRAGMERAGHRLAWDNTNGRLGRVGKGIPVPKSLSGLAVIDQVEASAAAAAKVPPVTPRTPIASGPAPRTPVASGPSVNPPQAAPPKATMPRPTGRISGARAMGTGIKVLGVMGNLGMIEELRNAFEGLGPQVDLEGLDPSDFDVGFEIKAIRIGPSQYIDVRVERNIIFRRKFYVVKAYVLA